MERLLVRSATVLPSTRARAAGDGVHVSGALFRPSRTATEILWDARWVLSYEDADAVRSGETRTLAFATALPDGETMEPATGLEPVVERGRLTGVRLDARALEDRTVRARFRQPAVEASAAPLRIGAPVAAGTSAQIIDGDLGAGARLEITNAPRIERHVGFAAPPAVGHAAREEARRLTGYTARVSGSPLYVRGEDVRADDGLTARVVTAAARRRGTFPAMALGFAAIVGLLVVAMRRLQHRAGVERADAILAAEIDGGEAGR